MQVNNINEILKQYDIPDLVEVLPLKSGLINYTFKIIQDKGPRFILQQFNTQVFKNPQIIDANLLLLQQYLISNNVNITLSFPIEALDGKTIVHVNGAYFRLFKFIPDSKTINVVDTADQAYHAAVQFGKFTSSFKHLDTSLLKPALPHFHDLNLRYSQFAAALINGDKDRIQQSATLIKSIEDHINILHFYQKIVADKLFIQRVTHHDTKISNVLFDHNDKGICVIDLDTVMSGYMISDLGDMFRTYLSPANEEETDIKKIYIRKEMYEAILEGYLKNMSNHLTETELGHLNYAGEFMIYMQALRFLTDHLNNDIYYGSSYPGHNYNRARNQLALLQKFCDFKRTLVGI